MHNFIWNRYYLANIDLNSNFVWRTWRSRVADNVRRNDKPTDDFCHDDEISIPRVSIRYGREMRRGDAFSNRENLADDTLLSTGREAFVGWPSLFHDNPVA